MSKQARTVVTHGLTGIAAGLALGLILGWLWPVQYRDTDPSVLRQDYRDDYLVMVATTYEIEGNLDRARQRLTLLNPQNPAAPVVDLTERLVEAEGNLRDIQRLARLAWDLETVGPSTVSPTQDSP